MPLSLHKFRKKQLSASVPKVIFQLGDPSQGCSHTNRQVSNRVTRSNEVYHRL
jgi:hypothetical protein